MVANALCLCCISSSHHIWRDISEIDKGSTFADIWCYVSSKVPSKQSFHPKYYIEIMGMWSVDRECDWKIHTKKLHGGSTFVVNVGLIFAQYSPLLPPCQIISRSGFSRYLVFIMHLESRQPIPRCIAKTIYLKKLELLTIWKGGSTFVVIVTATSFSIIK